LKIALGTLKDRGDELATFLEPRVGTKPSVSSDSLELEDGSIRVGVRPRHVKTYIKRFMYMKGVKKNYRVFVSGAELTIQEIELGKEEEKKEEKTKEEKGAKKEAEEQKGKEEPPIAQSKEVLGPKKGEPPTPKVPVGGKLEKKAASKKKPVRKKKAESED